MSRSTARPPRARDPYGVGPLGTWLAPGLSIVGLLLIALVTLSLLNGEVPFVGGGGGAGAVNGGNGTTRTPAPSNVVIAEPEVAFPGSIVYAKAGNIWVQSGDDVRQVTEGGRDSMPSFSPDGASIYFIRSRDEVGVWPAQGDDRRYQMTIPSVMRIPADGGKVERVLDGRVRKSGKTWFSWIRQPVLAPDGQTLTMVSDGPDPTKSDVVLQFYDLESKERTIPDVSEIKPLGHQDPVWRKDGRILLYVRNGREGARGAPIIFRWDQRQGRSNPLTGPGYLNPSFSPDGKYIAATKTSSFGNDIVVLEASKGREVARITDDGRSWAPVWSPAGDAIAFLNIDGQIVDLRMASLEGTAPDWTVKEITNLTEVSGLDGASRPAWYIPADQMPATPVPTAAPSASAGASVAP